MRSFAAPFAVIRTRVERASTPDRTSIHSRARNGSSVRLNVGFSRLADEPELSGARLSEHRGHDEDAHLRDVQPVRAQH